MIGIKGKERPVEIRFWEKVQKGKYCWNWIGAIDNVGYGSLRIKGKTHRAHRVAFEMAYGPIPAGKVVCHSCDNRRCVNPSHLFLGTMKDNSQDMVKKGRCNPPKGIKSPSHKLTEGQVKEIRSRFKSGESTRKIAKDFLVAHSTIWNIVTHHKWAWL